MQEIFEHVLDEIKLIAAGLSEGETYRGSCLACGRPKTMTVTREAGSIVWNCYSVHCDLVGRLGSRTTAPSRNLLCNKSQDISHTKVRPYTGPLQPLDDDWIEYLRLKIGFNENHFDIARPLYAPEEHRIAYPIYGPMGLRRGYVLRSYSLGVEPKALTRMEVDEPTLAWFRPRPAEQTVLVVEDIPSAVRAYQYVPQAVAMNSGGISHQPVYEIAQFARHIRWAFDQDATLAALRHHRKYGIFFESSSVLPLEKDLKEMRETDLAALLAEL